MLWIDFALMWLVAYRWVDALKVIAPFAEKLALAFIFALALKSLILFSLICLGIQPSMGIQLGVGLLALGSLLLLPAKLLKDRERSLKKNSRLIGGTVLVVGVLFVFSMINAWFFPITEPDAVWYQIRGMSFFHETRFDSESVVPQLKQYPPLIPLLYAYLIAFDVNFFKIFFPALYLCLIIIFYSRVKLLAENEKVACLFTLILATTPYIWWHGVLPLLDLTTAVFYSTGTLYWCFWFKGKMGDPSSDEENFYALISGVLLGLAAWTRIEFLLYDLVPVFFTLYVYSRYPDNNGNLKPLKLFFSSLLFFPSLWFLNLMTFNMELWSQIKMVGMVCVFLWVLALGLTFGKWKFSESNIKFAFLLSVIGYFVILFSLPGESPVPVWKKLAISFYRTSIVHIFYLFTTSLVIFIFFEKLKSLSDQKKILGFYVILFLSIHMAIFSLATPKWDTLTEFVYATFIQPGNSVNLSDTRGMLSIYPVILFFISSLPFIKQRVKNE